MSKIVDYDLSQLPQEPIDCIEDIRNVINRGLYQTTVVTSPPNWVARRGETAILVTSGNSGRFYFCNSDNSAVSWVPIFNF